MVKSLFIIFLFHLSIQGLAQSPSTKSNGLPVTYHPPSEDKPSRQRLLLLLSSTYLHVVKEGQVDLDNGLFDASRYLGLSRLSLIAEGIDDPELIAQSTWVDRRTPGDGIQLLSQATGKKHLEILVLLGAYYAFQPQSYHRYRDSVGYFLTRAINESKIIKEGGLGRQALCLLGKMFVQANELTKGDSVFKQAIRESKDAGDKETEARALAYRGLYTSFSPSGTQDRIFYLQQAINIYGQLNNIEGEINALTNLGYLHMTAFRLDSAHNVFLKALQLEDSIGFINRQYNTDALAMVTGFQGKFGEPFKYTLETIKAAEDNRDSIGWGYFYSRLGSLYHLEGGRRAESLKWFQKGLDRLLKAEDESAIYLTVTNIANTLLLDDRKKEALDLVINVSKKQPPRNARDSLSFHMALASCYSALKQHELAETHAILADIMQKKTESFIGPFRRSEVTVVFANVYFYQGQYAKSKLYLEKYLADPTRTSAFLQTTIGVYDILIQIDSIFNDPVARADHFSKYTELLMSNFEGTKLRQAEEFRVLYETEEKENQITLLNQQAKLERATTKQAMLVKNVTIGGIIAALIIAALLFRQNRLKQKSNIIVTQKNELLQNFLTEKEWLLKEIHHRVKNNLQIVMSLLNSQSAYINNDAALSAIHDSQHRVHAMSLIHQKLYNSDNVSSIDMSIYIRELASYLRDSFNTGQRIRFEFTIDPLVLDVSQAIPLGLILNEAITNSIKYAFPGDRDGTIQISLSNDFSNHYLLTIIDNGIGMPVNIAKNKPDSLGMSLMEGLSQDIDADFSMENNNGTEIKISFVQEPINKRPDILTSSFVTSN